MEKDQNKTKGIVHSIKDGLEVLKEKAANIQNEKALKEEFDEGWESLQNNDDLGETKKKVVLELSLMSVFKSTLIILAVLVGAYVFFSIESILVLFFIAFFIAAALDPLIDTM